MIEVGIGKNEITVRGHARAGPRGQDIVCAGISALTAALIEGVEEFTPDDVRAAYGPGTADIIWTGKPSAELRILVDGFFIGICGIANAYPENVRIRTLAE